MERARRKENEGEEERVKEREGMKRDACTWHPTGTARGPGGTGLSGSGSAAR